MNIIMSRLTLATAVGFEITVGIAAGKANGFKHLLIGGAATGRWERLAPADDETAFTARAISYADFGAAVAEVATSSATGAQLIAWPR